MSFLFYEINKDIILSITSDVVNIKNAIAQ